MRPFIGGGTTRWNAGERVPHIYALPELDREENAAFANLVRRHRDILTDRFTHMVAPVQPAWLHATVQMVGAPGQAPLTAPRRAALIERFTGAFTGTPAFTTVAAPSAGGSGAVLDLDADEAFAALTDTATQVIREVLGTDAVSYQPSAPHITTGYCHTAGDSGDVASALRRSRPARAPLRITRLALVEVIQDADAHEYRWNELAGISLA
ncbi:hypothetical protein CLV63_112103 [Murinocardiopsis flavida]|uniref:2'-5' RNA ligase superfamily protein n=1 Tax=Murinocardiopsis flavida TaxID=645275 RepID=A0A2P8DG83_9ACTN|nr:hypothetical protein [Murinocardiopsis flavida]PSK96221.1 hypothetical protein CLV63_112103 [Murinocardiopsis flavida]